MVLCRWWWWEPDLLPCSVPPLTLFVLHLQLRNKFMKKLPRDAEASNVLVGEVDFLDAPFVAFVRLQQAVMLGALTEVPVPTRYWRSLRNTKCVVKCGEFMLESKRSRVLLCC